MGKGHRNLLLEQGMLSEPLFERLSLNCGFCAIAAFLDDDLNGIMV
jgi:hypothetical protein